MKKSFIASSIIFSMLGTPVFADGLLTQKQAEPVQAQVTVQATPQITEEQASDMVDITKMPMPLSSKLKKKYNAYKITLRNDYPNTLKLQNTSITNGLPGIVAYSNVETTKAWALTGLLLFPIGLLIIGLPVLTSINKGNSKAETEAMGYTNQVPAIDIRHGDIFTFNALVPLGQTPQISLSFKDSKAGLQFVKNAL